MQKLGAGVKIWHKDGDYTRTGDYMIEKQPRIQREGSGNNFIILMW